MQTFLPVPVAAVSKRLTWAAATPLFVCALLIGVSAPVVGCGRGREPQLARFADRHAESLAALADVTAPTDPRKPGIEQLHGETAELVALLPKLAPEERLPAVPFREAVAAAAVATEKATEAGADADGAARAGLEASKIVVSGDVPQIRAALEELKATSAASSSSGIIGAIAAGITGLLGLLGPWGAAAVPLVTAGFGIYENIRRRRTYEHTKAAYQSIEAAKDAVWTTLKERGIEGLTEQEVRATINRACSDVQKVLPDYGAVVAEILRIKEEYNKGRK